MNKLIVKRPKDRERLYSEGTIKIFINGKLVEKIKQNQIKEIEIDESLIEIQAKLRGGHKSQKKTIDITKKKEIFILLNTKIEIHPLLFLSLAFPIFVFAMNHEKYQSMKIIAFILALLLFIRAVIQFYRINKTGILIEEATEN